ncbi:hypothetical protein DOM22_03015 [Bdellovibrio sp. ZAP7]|uniref:substrate-binding periplasmic protein n=1 Tax=Bdellovibrio sp. ZAP7 TaxID=2231053 RepID=UPI001158B4F8|nr:transporter substrate-binding domain-containing protein [Bdellovibrio sp. ZAP7]QDK44194.1 hypothetical protein DOM22_03015 [Bdellovibrio sp. ZAP7]
MKTLVWTFLLSTAVVIFAFLSVVYASDEAITLQLRYHPRPPLLEVEGGNLTGFCGTPAVRALERAGISYSLVESPPFRQLALIQSGEGYDCAVGWLKVPDREKIYKYSDPVCDDGAWFVVGHKGSFDKSINKIDDLLKNRRLKLINRRHYSFGAQVDTLAKRYNTNITYIENAEITPQMFEMIHAGRVDYTFVSGLELDYVLKRFKWAASDFILFQPADVAHSSPRYFICSKKVPDEMIRKINEAIQKTTDHPVKTETK